LHQGSTVRALLSDLRTTPNLVTLSRLALVLAVFISYLSGLYVVGAVLGAVAGATDYLDGWLARRTGQVTRLGEILDQFCDVALELSFFVFAITLHALPVVVLVPHVLRELWVVSIRRYAIELGENIPSRLPGKIKASVIGWSMLPLLVGAVGLARSWSPALIRFGQIGILVGLVLSVVSGIAYTVSFVRIYEHHRRSRRRA
jgi:CDP-diacylglycerol--glycerol-3-phosphate 3-phosphatidyltransferase